MGSQAAIGQYYGDPEGWDLRVALAAKLGVRTEEIVLGPGIDGLLGLLCRTLADAKSPVVTTLGSYPTFEFGAIGAGLQIHRVLYGQDRIDLDALADKAHEVHARIVYLANPDNPSGSWHSAQDIADFRARLPESAYLLLDEAYSDFAPSDAVGPLDPSDAGVVRVRTFSKGHGMAGLRVAYVVGHEKSVRLLDRIRMHFGVSSVAQAGALASLADSEHLARVLRETEAGKRRLAAIAISCGLRPLPSATNFLTIDVGDKPRADALLEALLDEGVFIRKPWHAPLDRCVRITIGRTEDIDVLEPILVRCVRTLPEPFQGS